MKPIMLALSTFRQSDDAVQLAIEKAKTNKNLVVAYIVDENLARYLVGIDTELSPNMKDKSERDILAEHKIQAETKVESIVTTAKEFGINVKTYIDIARFGIECVEIAKKEKPELIITTRTKRPQWVKKLFGSPVDYLIEHAGCPVKEV